MTTVLRLLFILFIPLAVESSAVTCFRLFESSDLFIHKQISGKDRDHLEKLVSQGQDLIEKITGVRPAIGIVLESSSADPAHVNLNFFTIHLAPELVKLRSKVSLTISHELGHILLAILFSQHWPSLGFFVPSPDVVEKASQLESRFQQLRRAQNMNRHLEWKTVRHDPEARDPVYGTPHLWARSRKLRKAEEKTVADINAIRKPEPENLSWSFDRVLQAVNEFYADLTAVLITKDPKMGAQAQLILELTRGFVLYDFTLRDWDRVQTIDDVKSLGRNPDPYIALSPVQHELLTLIKASGKSDAEVLKITFQVLSEELKGWSEDSAPEDINWPEIHARLLQQLRARLK